MIPACQDEISTRPDDTDFTLRLHVGIKFCPGKAGQFSTWYLIRFACLFFGFFLVSMSFYKTEDSQISIDLKFFYLTCLASAVSILFLKIRSSRSQIFLKIGVLKNFAVFTRKHQRWSLFLIKLQTGRSAKRLQHRCFPVNIAQFLRIPFLQNILQNTSGGCFCKMMKFYKDIC